MPAPARVASLALLTALLATATAALLVPTVAFAQEEGISDPEGAEDPLYRLEFGLYGGGHFFSKKHSLRVFHEDPQGLSPKEGAAIGARASVNINHHVSFEVDGWWSPTKTRGGRDDTLGDLASDLSVFGVRGSLLLDFVGGGPVRPFLNVGVGVMYSIVQDANLRDTTRPNDPNNFILPNDNDTFLHAGVGAKIFFTPRFGLRLDGIIMAPPAFASDVIKIGEETSFGGPDFQVLGTLFFNFLEVPLPSRQVIVKKETVVMSPPTPVDPDGDGVSGDADKCPTVAEDRDGFEDDDGCPDNDNDKDGVPDAQDRCPMKAETVNAIDDADGCPEEDTDGDGFVGSRDKCPDAPETKNGYQDDDGCPDELPAAVKKFTGVIEGINFKTGSANILPGSYSVLDRAVQVLKDFPEIRLEIQGHTDNRGRATYNKDLSQRRADAVKTYFVSRGIASDRLLATGFGMDVPIGDNASESGRARNRRTEFKLIMAP
jgi:outer membrane protein OmpA-like peptidoglycan-associated protein